MYPFLPIGLIAVFFVYIAYLLFVKKDIKKFKTVFYPGMFFIALWAIIYYYWLR